MNELLRLAEDYEVTVVTTTLPGDLLGCFLPRLRRICLDARLTPAENRSVLAHELGHVHLGHPAPGPRSPREREREERQADRFAARLLIDPGEYARLEQVSADVEFIADELCVTAEVVETYRADCLTRLEGVSYALPGLGRGQWSYRGFPAGAS